MTIAHGPSSAERVLLTPTPERPGHALPSGHFCGRCDGPLVDGEAELLDASESMSGARLDTWFHPVGHSDCRPYPAAGLRGGRVGGSPGKGH